MASTLREELASLKIDRPNSIKAVRNGHGKPSPRRGGGGLRLISWLLWMIPLGLLGAAGVYGYRQYDQMRSRAEVTIGTRLGEDLGGGVDAARCDRLPEVAVSGDDRHQDRRAESRRCG